MRTAIATYPLALALLLVGGNHAAKVELPIAVPNANTSSGGTLRDGVMCE